MSRAALSEAHRLTQEREQIDQQIDALMKPIYADLMKRSGQLKLSATLTAEIQALRNEVATWPRGVHRTEAMTHLNWLDREA